MGKYLKQFENHTAYAAAQSSLILPNVSLCVQENEVYYNPYVDPCQRFDYVDLGLPSGTKWATKNVGACNETDFGNYYQYGKGAAQYATTSGDSNYSGTENPLAVSADTAAQVWGGDWHVPTQTQFKELTANTTYEWTSIDGVNGGKFTAKDGSGNYVFFPAASYWSDGSKSQGNSGCYWSSTPNGNNFANFLYFENSNKSVYIGNFNYGYTVRGVLDE